MGTGNNIRTIRILKNRSQEFLANEIGLSTKWLGKLENEQEEISEDNLKAIAKVLEVAPEDIKTFQDRAIFNNCNNSGIHNTYNYTSFESIERHYQQIIIEKDKIIKEQQKQIESLK